MTPVEQQTQELKQQCPAAVVTLLPTGGYLVEVRKYSLPPGWNRKIVTIIFLAPPGYPAAQPDCFWVEPEEPGPMRLANGATPHGTNDTNPVPGVGPRGTWFSWHLQQWDPNHDTLVRYLNVIKQRLCPAR
jgi:hypothetical protein